MDSYPKEIYEGLRVPSGESKTVKKHVKEVIVEPVLTNDEIKAREGTYFSDKEVDKIFDTDVDVYRKDTESGEKKLLLKFRKNVFSDDEIKTGWEGFYQTAAASRNRGAAAGPINMKSNYWKRRKPVEITKWSTRYVQDGKVSKMRVNNNVMSSVLGFFEKTPFMGLPCRLTSYTQRFFKQYKHGIPFIEAIDDKFKKLVPDAYAEQHAAASRKPMYRIANTAFSSVTLNRNFRTALHMDDGDFREGFGNLSVIERGEYSGGNTLFPQYGIGIDVRTGDFLAMDVHQWHCNTELYETPEQAKRNKALPDIYKDNPTIGTMGSNKGYTRISFVCYLREKLRNCQESQTRKYYKKIHFDSKKGVLGKTKTRKHGRGE
jgi:hypothetical protein